MVGMGDAPSSILAEQVRIVCCCQAHYDVAERSCSVLPRVVECAIIRFAIKAEGRSRAPSRSRRKQQDPGKIIQREVQT